MAYPHELVTRSLYEPESLFPLLFKHILPKLRDRLSLIEEAKHFDVFGAIQYQLCVAWVRGNYSCMVVTLWWLYDMYDGVKHMMRVSSVPTGLDWDHVSSYVHRLIHMIKTFEITKENAPLSCAFFHLQMLYVVGQKRADILAEVHNYPISLKLQKKNTNPPHASLYLPPSHNLL